MHKTPFFNEGLFSTWTAYTSPCIPCIKHHFLMKGSSQSIIELTFIQSPPPTPTVGKSPTYNCCFATELNKHNNVHKCLFTLVVDITH